MADIAFSPPCPIAEVPRLEDEEFILPLECTIPEFPKPRIGYPLGTGLGLPGPRGLPGEKGEKGDKGDKGDPGDKYAIVSTVDGPVGLYCMEATEALFFDVLRVSCVDNCHEESVDPVFLQTIEAGTLFVAFAASEDGPVGFRLQSNRLRLTCDGRRRSVAVILGGIRKGRAGLRLPRFSEEQQAANARFWDSSVCPP